MIRSRRLDRRGFLALLRACKDRARLTARRDFFLIYFAGRTGLRASELLASTVGDVETQLDPPFVWVRTLKQKARRVTRRIASAGGGHRVLAPVPPRDQVLLEARAVKRFRTYTRRVLPKLLGREVTAADHLFPAPMTKAQRLVNEAKGAHTPTRPMSLRNLDRIFASYHRRARLRPGITFHSLRHFRGMTLYTESGHDLEFARQQLRHADIRTTQQYLGVDPEVERRYLNRLDRRS